MSLDQFLGEPVINAVYTPEACEQRKLRCRVAYAAYTYEYHSESVMSDEEFDECCKKIDPKISTGNPVMDEFYRTKFSPDTGMWIHEHPEIDRIMAIYFMSKNKGKNYYRDKNKIYELVKEKDLNKKKFVVAC